MRAKVYVADYAQVLDGKLVCVGLAFIGLKRPGPFALVVILELNHAELGNPFDFDLVLVDGDGQPFPAPDGNPTKISGRDITISERDVEHRRNRRSAGS